MVMSEAAGREVSLQSRDMAEIVKSESERQARYNPAEIEPKWQAR
jgi:leucyl-tRNA synthetase